MNDLEFGYPVLSFLDRFYLAPETDQLSTDEIFAAVHKKKWQKPKGNASLCLHQKLSRVVSRISRIM